MTGAVCSCSAPFNALVPSITVNSPSPAACRRACTPWPAAMPTSAQGPHCKLDATSPQTRRLDPRASRQELAAA
eukprot:scaffold2982_cov154-Isochrysis_galbana.AAC.2